MFLASAVNVWSGRVARGRQPMSRVVRGYWLYIARTGSTACSSSSCSTGQLASAPSKIPDWLLLTVDCSVLLGESDHSPEIFSARWSWMIGGVRCGRPRLLFDV